MTQRIQELLASSRQVIQDCTLPNGALVAANSARDYFPKEAKDYRFVWPRDAFYICRAAKLVGLDIQHTFFTWLMHAESWQKTGLFYENYHVSGTHARHNFQPDQTGSVLLSVCDTYCDKGGMPDDIKHLLKHSADGLCKVWKKDHFVIATQDLWEERLCFPDLRENFTYSLAACSAGLRQADALIPTKRWKQVSEQMIQRIHDMDGDHLYRSSGKISDRRVDASLLGLAWPFGIVEAGDVRMRKTLALIEDRLLKDGGVHRYEHDDYDGWMYNNNVHRKKGAGYWPLLTFWLSIYWAERGERKKARKYYDQVLHDLKGKHHIPEQIFDNDIQVSVSPLAWSHAMFVLATERLMPSALKGDMLGRFKAK